jgi:NAD(P)H-dependent flavin oxidoreductase YrpB (nitropropane dioxygenase family)
MLKTKLTEMLGIKHPIIQAGMGPFSNNQLCVASANAGVLGLLSTSGLFTREINPGVFKSFVETAGATLQDDIPTVLRKLFMQTHNAVKAKQGVFGINVMVSSGMAEGARVSIDSAIRIRNEVPEMKETFKVVFTSAGDPMPWGQTIKGAGFRWLHVVPSVKGAERCRKAGVELIVASGHEGGFHTSWEPVHSMILLPAVAEAMASSGIPVVGAGGFCDGKTLAAALALGGVGAQMGTRFLATRESDFAPMWKQGIVDAGDRGTLVARGFVGPARWIKTPSSIEHQKNTLKMSPGCFLGTPDDMMSVPPELLMAEINGINAVYDGDKEKALYAGGECSQRIDGMPAVQELVDQIMKEAEAIVAGFPGRFLAA